MVMDKGRERVQQRAADSVPGVDCLYLLRLDLQQVVRQVTLCKCTHSFGVTFWALTL